MKTFEIWVEGFAATGESAKASLLGSEKAETFEGAIKKYIEKNPKRGIEKRGEWYVDWGCRLFDNEIDARKSFG